MPTYPEDVHAEEAVRLELSTLPVQQAHEQLLAEEGAHDAQPQPLSLRGRLWPCALRLSFRCLPRPGLLAVLEDAVLRHVHEGVAARDGQSLGRACSGEEARAAAAPAGGAAVLACLCVNRRGRLHPTRGAAA